MAHIKILSDELINQIAAGEIIERPASIVKELVENSIDACSTEINIFLQNAGRTKLVIEDNGTGINRDELQLAVKRHATSKLTEDNLFDITSYGFRGEALPSIASISQFTIESDETAIHIDFGGEPSIINSAVTNGTRVTVQNIFDRIPARLKFLRSDNIEQSHCLALIENFAITHPSIKFTVRDDVKTILSFTENDKKSRIAEVVGQVPLSRSIYIEETDETISVNGYFGHPIDSKYSQNSQRIFINNRWVKDRTISSAIKTAFKDLLPAGRFATCVLFIDINPFYLDINVSPTKSEVRFRDSRYVQKFITDVIRKNLSKFDKVSLSVDDNRIVIPRETPSKIYSINQPYSDMNNVYDNLARKLAPTDIPNVETKGETDNVIHLDDVKSELNQEHTTTPDCELVPKCHDKIVNRCVNESVIENPLYTDGNIEICSEFWGNPIGQIFDTYLLCQAGDDLVIIDQHAVHEKITMEKILKNINAQNIQYLTRSEIIDLTTQQQHIANEALDTILQCGFDIEISSNKLIVSAIPAVLNVSNAKQFLCDMLDHDNAVSEVETKDTIRLKIANIACHNSIRAGRKLTIDEIKSILREMEQTESIHQCNHHRPTFVKISKKQLEKIFERS